mgnify:CR=1 FL=1
MTGRGASCRFKILPPPDSYYYSKFEDKIQVGKIAKFSTKFLVGVYKCEIPFATTGREGLKKEPH